jgi:DNA-binding GntR family transcriptional regulator
VTDREDDDSLKFDREGPDLVYMQIADHIEHRIRSGSLQSGARLSSERDLAEEYGVAYLTVRRATAELRTRGLIRTIHGKGNYVLRPEDEPEGE